MLAPGIVGPGGEPDGSWHGSLWVGHDHVRASRSRVAAFGESYFAESTYLLILHNWP